jgi:quercetin dioxygenase-like cupin family protein
VKLENITFTTIDWISVPVEERAGEKGVARSRTFAAKGLRVRMVEYSPGYSSDHWCHKGHVVLCVRGEIVTNHMDGSAHRIREGTVYVVGDNGVPHRSSSEGGATLFIVD